MSDRSAGVRAASVGDCSQEPYSGSVPAPYWLARFNRRVTNRVLPRLLHGAPAFAMVGHLGRRTQRQYRTPVLAFPRAGRYVVALTYGPATDWVQNVLVAGGCTLEYRGRFVSLRRPRLYRAEAPRHLPPLIRAGLRLMRVTDFLELESPGS